MGVSRSLQQHTHLTPSAEQHCTIQDSWPLQQMGLLAIVHVLCHVSSKAGACICTPAAAAAGGLTCRTFSRVPHTRTTLPERIVTRVRRVPTCRAARLLMEAWQQRAARAVGTLVYPQGMQHMRAKEGAWLHAYAPFRGSGLCAHTASEHGAYLLWSSRNSCVHDEDGQCTASASPSSWLLCSRGRACSAAATWCTPPPSPAHPPPLPQVYTSRPDRHPAVHG